MKINAIIQARMGSKRLPGKVMKTIRGKPLIGYLMERVALSCVDEINVTIPTSDYGSKLMDYVQSVRSPNGRTTFVPHMPLGLWTGPEDDVAERFRHVLIGCPCDAFVRICADSPLLDPKLIDEAIDLFRKEKPTVACNVFPRTYPAGQSVEVIDTAHFLAAIDAMNEKEREHVVPYFYYHEYEVSNFKYFTDLSETSMTVDTQEDFDRIKAVIRKLERPHTEYGWQELALLL